MDPKTQAAVERLSAAVAEMAAQESAKSAAEAEAVRAHKALIAAWEKREAAMVELVSVLAATRSTPPAERTLRTEITVNLSGSEEVVDAAKAATASIERLCSALNEVRAVPQ
jgi:hypothetical protein